MTYLEILSGGIDNLIPIILALITPWITAHANVWNQNYSVGKNKDQWLTSLKKCGYIYMGFEQIKTYENDISNRYSLLWDSMVMVSIVVIIELITAELTISDSENISVFIYVIDILIVIILFRIYHSYLKSKNLLKPQFSEELRIKKQSRNIFYGYYLLVGTIVGINIGALTQIYSHILTSTSLSSNIWFYVYLLMGITTSVIFLLRLKEIISSIYFESVKKIMDSHRYHFPHVTIKTQSGTVSGQLVDVLNKNTITLNGDSKLKTILWSKIEVMEIKNTT